MLVGCVVSGVPGLVLGAGGGGIVGIVTGPLEPLVGVAGAVVGGILGCSGGALAGGLEQLILFEPLEWWDARQEAKKDESVCEKQATDLANGL